LKYAGKSFYSKNVFGLLIFITHFIILADELRIRIRHVYRNNGSIGFFFCGFNRLIWWWTFWNSKLFLGQEREQAERYNASEKNLVW